MARILVCSDSHGRPDLLHLALEQQPGAEYLVFLGDGAADADYFTRLPGKQAYIVRGNCDGDSQYPLWQSFSVAGITVICTHGHHSYVKYSLADLLHTAQAQGAALALYGHTHEARLDYEDGIYLFNPGCMHEGRYGFVDITPAGIVCQHCKVRRWL